MLNGFFQFVIHFIKPFLKGLLIFLGSIAFGFAVFYVKIILDVVGNDFLYLEHKKSPRVVTDIGTKVALSAPYRSRSFYNCIIQNDKVKCWSNFNPIKKTVPELSANNIDIIQTSNESIVYSGCVIKKGVLKCWYKSNNGKKASIKVLEADVTTFSINKLSICAIQKGALKCAGFKIGFNIIDGEINKTAYNANMKIIEGLESQVTNIGLEDDYACAIQKGALKCWGNNKYGQLGIGTKKESLIPKVVKGLESGVTDISLKPTYACAIQKGALKCWGNNKYGQLGIGTKKESLIPKVVKGLESGVKNISLESNYACAIQKGALKCWGNNKYGQLGIGTRKTSLIPKVAKGMESGVTSVKVSDRSLLFNHTCVIQRGGVKCTGNNLYDQLGNPLVISPYSKVFTSVASLDTNVKSLVVSNGYSCAIQKQILKCWGKNMAGQLGNGKKEISQAGIIKTFWRILNQIIYI